MSQNIVLQQFAIAIICVFQTAPECRLSPLSLSYGGSQNITAQGNPCVAWKKIPEQLQPKKWQFSTRNLTRVGSTCQNPDDDVNGPWCYVSTDTYRVEYCNISYCGTYAW